MAFPYIVPSSALSKAGSVAANSRIVMGCIGTGLDLYMTSARLNHPAWQMAVVDNQVASIGVS